MLSALLAVTLMVTPTCTAEVQPGAVVFTLTADQVEFVTLYLESGGREWTALPAMEESQYSVRLDTAQFPPFAEMSYRWAGTWRDMTAFEVGGTVTLADTAHDWMSARGDRAMVWWYDQPTEYGLRALATVDAQLARLAGLPGGVERVRLVIYQAQADYEDAGLRSGVAFGDTAVVWPSCGEGYLFETTIPHEVLHLKIAAYRDKLPLWFSEGLAVWSEPRAHAGELALARTGAPFTWDEMQRKSWTDVASQQRWYAQAFALVDYIDREKRLPELLEYLAATPNAGFEDAARAVIGLNSAQVMQEWRIDAGLEARPRKRISPMLLRGLIIGGHMVALAGLTWLRWRWKTTTDGEMDDEGRQ